MWSTVTESFFVADFSYSYSYRLLVLRLLGRRGQGCGSKSTSKEYTVRKESACQQRTPAADRAICAVPGVVTRFAG